MSRGNYALPVALILQAENAAAEKPEEVGVKFFVPSEFGNTSQGETEGIFGEKAVINKTEGRGYPLHRLLHWSVPGLHLGVVCAFSSSLWTPVERNIYAPGSWLSIPRVGK